ncbi:MAG: FtsH protease activity modulator HflK [Chitinophagales bacterium]|nr:FtsH protease activity modulator HflK [Hyphomicrobiales bacterium]
MPWSSQNGGGGWKGGGGGGGPWGQGPGGGAGGPSPDLEELLKRSQDRLKQAMPGGGLSGLLIAVLLFGGLLAVAIYGFTVRVQPEQIGVVLRFGKFDRTLNPGLNFRWPHPVETVYTPNVTFYNRTEIGFSTAQISNYSGPTTSGSDVPKESLMLTGDENIVDVDFIVLWRIKDAAAFLFNIQDAPSTVKAVAESAMREVTGAQDITPILTKSRKETEDAVLALMQKTLDSYGAGVEIQQVNLQKVDPPSQVIDAFRDVQAARADQERLQNEAQGYANKVIPEARGESQKIIQAAQGYREQAVAEATGRTQRFLKVYEEYAKAPEVTRQRIFLETMERVFGNMDKIIIDEKGAGGVVPYLPLNEVAKPRPDATGRTYSTQGN